MDGTLLDSESLSTKSTEFAFQEVLGRKLTGDENSRLIGRPVEKVLKKWFPDDGDEIYRVGAEHFETMVDGVAPFSKPYEILCEVLFGSYAISVLPASGASGLLLTYRYSSIMDGKEDSALTGNGSPQRSRPRRVIASEANLSLS